MKNVIDIFVLSCLVWVCQYFLPWYIFVLLAFLFGMFRAGSWKRAFFIAMLSVFIVWSVYPLVISLQDDFRTAEVISAVFGDLGAVPILFINGLVFGLLAGLAGLSGYSFSNIK